MAGFAFLFAPTAFAHEGPTPAFAATIADSVRKIGWLGDVCGILTVLLTMFSDTANRLKTAVIASIAIALAGGFYEASVIVSRMEKTPLLTPAYEALHRQSSGVYSVVLLAVVTAFVCTALTRRGRP